MNPPPTVVFYSKPGCCLCATLESTLRSLQPTLDFAIEMRDITTDSEWFSDFQYMIPVLEVAGKTVPDISHRIGAGALRERLAASFAASM